MVEANGSNNNICKENNHLTCKRCNEHFEKNRDYYYQCENCYGEQSNGERKKLMLFGKCKKCSQINTGDCWCKSCNSKQFQQDFSRWTSEHELIDRLIRGTQLNAKNEYQILEWIPYDRLGEKYFDEGFGIAIWWDGPIKKWSWNEEKWIRHNGLKVALKKILDISNLIKEISYEV